MGRGGVVEGERVAGAVADAPLELADRGVAGADGAAVDPLPPAGAVAAAEEPEEADRFELGDAPLRTGAGLREPVEGPETSEA